MSETPRKSLLETLHRIATCSSLDFARGRAWEMIMALNHKEAGRERCSLLDQIHNAMRFAVQTGQPELAEWMGKHADKACPAAIAQATDDGDDLATRIARYCENRFTDEDGDGSFESVVDGIRDLLPSDPSAPNASRTDAAKEAIDRAWRHPDCDGYNCKQPLTPANYRATRRPYDVQECAKAYIERPILTALAAAERKLAGKSAEVERAGAQCNLLHGKIATVERKLADAEKRAKELERIFMPPDHPLRNVGRTVTAEEFANFHRCKPPLGNPTREEAIERNAALTRQLATIRHAVVGDLLAPMRDEWSNQSIRSLAAAPMPSDMEGWAQQKKMMATALVTIADTLAEIDAPAAEEGASSAPPVLRKRHYVVPECAQCPNDQQHIDHIHPTRCAWCSDLGKRVQFGAPPPEPANAKGSEVPRDVCNECGATSDHSDHRADTDGGHDFVTELQPSPQPFTVEEALTQAEQHSVYGRACFTDPMRRSLLRIATTLRDYANMKEHDDALERAAEDVIAAWGGEARNASNDLVNSRMERLYEALTASKR